MTQWNGKVPLIDFMCGSGTFLIEAVNQFLGVPINIDQVYLFENWLDFRQDNKGRFRQKINYLIKYFIHLQSIPPLLTGIFNDDFIFKYFVSFGFPLSSQNSQPEKLFFRKIPICSYKKINSFSSPNFLPYGGLHMIIPGVQLN